jgi:hypothetical protein
MKLRIFDWRVLVMIGLTAGVAQVAAGVAMYLAGVYFLAWSILISLLVLLLCIVLGTRWYKNHYMSGEITYVQALVVGIVISVSTGLVYAIYNIISISFFYPHFLDDLVRLSMAREPAGKQTPEMIALMKASITAPRIALANLIRLSVAGSFLSLITALFLKTRNREQQ